MRKAKLIEMLENESPRSAWGKGVREYALELVDRYYENEVIEKENLKHDLLNGASDWKEYSWGGGAFIYDSDIAERLCAPSELKRCNYGRKQPNGSEDWLDVQARALYQAYLLIVGLMYDYEKEGK